VLGDPPFDRDHPVIAKPHRNLTAARVERPGSAVGSHQKPLFLEFAEIATQRRGRHAQLGSQRLGIDFAAVTQE
jgi:hypothetical protein